MLNIFQQSKQLSILQTMIDILLNRQLEFGGVSTSHNGWVEPGSQVRHNIDPNMLLEIFLLKFGFLPHL